MSNLLMLMVILCLGVLLWCSMARRRVPIDGFILGAPGKLARSSRWKTDAGKVSSRPVASVAWWKVTTIAKRTQQLCGVGY